MKEFYVSLTYLAIIKVEDDNMTEEQVRELIEEDVTIPESFGEFNINDIEVSKRR